MKELTIEQALKEGYTRYGYSNMEWQTAYKIEDIEWDGNENSENLVLFDKEEICPSISKEAISDLLSGHIYEEECSRDDESVYKTVKSIDFKEMAVKINKELEQHKYWMITDIKLIP